MTRSRYSGLLLALLAAGVARAGSPVECRQLAHRGRAPEAAACYKRLLAAGDLYTRAEAFWGLERYEEANTLFRQAVAKDERQALYRVRWGRLLLERFNPVEAAKLFEEALVIDPVNADAYYGLALAAAGNFDAKAVEFARRALQLRPGMIEARELLARLALEDGDFERARMEAGSALAQSDEALDAMAVHAAANLLEDRNGTEWFERALRVNPGYGRAYALAADLFILNRRYEEGIRLYEKAIGLDPRLWQARADLGVNLMRLGKEAEARRHLELCYANGHRDAKTVNTLRLLDSYRNFEEIRADNVVLKLHRKESQLLAPYFKAELERAIATLEKRYRMRLNQPVLVEVYPDHEDFAVRTLGMPGLGALGVTFGYVVAMDSPSARKPGSFHWASTLWHELSHVFVLAATRHRAPRWFTEGLAVFEETAVSPEWGDRISGQVIQAIREKKLLPVSVLDRGFVRPSYPGQVIVSYFQAGKICEYINEQFGFGKLLEMLRAFSTGGATPDVLASALGIPAEEFDRRFLAWLEGGAVAVVNSYDTWKQRMKSAHELAQSQQWQALIPVAGEASRLFPDFVEEGSAFELLAAAHLALGNRNEAAAELERYVAAGGRSPELLKQLASLLSGAGRKGAAASVLERVNHIYPHDEALHRQLGDLYMETGNREAAVREYRAVVAMQPHDRAAAHFQLARALYYAGQPEEAREHLFLALEAAPGYRAAQKMLLELTERTPD